MRPGRAAVALAAFCASAACAGSRSAGGAPGTTRVIPLGSDIGLPAGPRLRSLPADQRFRFVAPDSIVRGSTSEDAASVRLVSDLRTGISVVLHSHGWRESSDSAEFDVAVFTSRRTMWRTEMREEQVPATSTSNLPRCDLSRMGNQPRCTNEPPQRTRTVRVSVPYTISRTHGIVRRRADGAVRYWSFGETDLERVKATIARDLLAMLLTPEG